MADERIETIDDAEPPVSVMSWTEVDGGWHAAWRLPGQSVWHPLTYTRPERAVAIDDAVSASREYLRNRQQMRHRRNAGVRTLRPSLANQPSANELAGELRAMAAELESARPDTGDVEAEGAYASYAEAVARRQRLIESAVQRAMRPRRRTR